MGEDSLVGGKEEDVLIGGSADVAVDNEGLMDDGFMDAVMAWADLNQSYQNRVLAMMAALTVLDDHETDSLNGSSGSDLYYDGIGDLLKGVKSDETVL